MMTLVYKDLWRTNDLIAWFSYKHSLISQTEGERKQLRCCTTKVNKVKCVLRREECTNGGTKWEERMTSLVTSHNPWILYLYPSTNI